jgi:hypothetical protein
MTQAELAVFAACYASELARRAPSIDNAAAEESLEGALWSVECFRQALRSRKR